MEEDKNMFVPLGGRSLLSFCTSSSSSCHVQKKLGMQKQKAFNGFILLATPWCICRCSVREADDEDAVAFSASFPCRHEMLRFE